MGLSIYWHSDSHSRRQRVRSEDHRRGRVPGRRRIRDQMRGGRPGRCLSAGSPAQRFGAGAVRVRAGPGREVNRLRRHLRSCRAEAQRMLGRRRSLSCVGKLLSFPSPSSSAILPSLLPGLVAPSKFLPQAQCARSGGVRGAGFFRPLHTSRTSSRHASVGPGRAARTGRRRTVSPWRERIRRTASMLPRQSGQRLWAGSCRRSLPAQPTHRPLATAAMRRGGGKGP